MTDQDDLRYPVGRFRSSAATTPDIRAEHIEVLRLLPERLRVAVAGLSEAQLDTPYRDGGWTVRQVVHHLADSHANSVIRFKNALTEDWPTVKPYDENAWAQLPDSKAFPIDSSLVFIDALHARWVALLQHMSEADFARGMVHPERGRFDLATTLAIYAWHSLHHTAHITNLRQRMAW